MRRERVGFVLFAGISALVAACGGSALSDGGSGSAGQAGVGGATGSAGASASAGQGEAGGSAAGAAGAAGAASDRCSQPAAVGMCEAYDPAFFHDSKTGLCQPFVYGGCGGNDNRFATRAACIAACPGGGTSWGECKMDADCALVGATCCEACDPVQDHDLLAINAMHVVDRTNAQCANVGACAPCPPVSESDATRQYFRAVCTSGQCSALDVRESPFTECKQDSDCVLRAGVACCSACTGPFAAVNASANFCPDGPQSCPKCASIPPKGQAALCQNNRCVATQTLE